MTAERMIKVMYVGNTGGGFARMEEIPEGTSIGDFFRKVKDGDDVNNYTILVGGAVVTRDTVLKDGERITITPKNLKGNDDAAAGDAAKDDKDSEDSEAKTDAEADANAAVDATKPTCEEPAEDNQE